MYDQVAGPSPGGASGGTPGVRGGEVDAARSLLAEAAAPTGGGAGVIAPLPSMQAPQVVETRATVADRRVIEAPIAAPMIDFVDIALSDTTRMVVPEHLDDDFEYTLRKYYRTERTGFLGMGDASRADEPGYFELEIRPKRSLRKLQTMPKDIVYVIDISGSIPQEWVSQITAGVSDALNALNEGDRFNIVFFSENPTLFSSDGVVAFNPQNVQKAQQFLRDRRAAGDTDVNRALSRLLVRDVAVERVYDLVMISDGRPTRGVMDTRELINLLTRDNDLAASIYCVGVGNGQNRELLEFLAYRNKGFCVFVDELGNAANGIRTLASRLRYPIMKDVRFNLSGILADEVFPRDVPNIHQGESFSIYGRFNRERPFTLQMIGHNGRGLLDFTVTRNIAEAEQGGDNVMQGWAFWKLHDLYNEMIRIGETDEIKRQIDYLRRKYNLRTLY
jgi:Ca-activated chloride channel family protein